MALYALALGYSNGIAPLIMGFINDGQGYQWVFVGLPVPASMSLSLIKLAVLVRHLLCNLARRSLFLHGGDEIRAVPIHGNPAPKLHRR